MANRLPFTRREFQTYLGEGLHTSFRKATDCPQAHPIWKLIQEMSDGEWTACLEFVVWGLEYSYPQLKEMWGEDGD